MVPVRPVTVCYSSASLALLQFVTNTLLAERIPGVRIQTALTRHEELEVRLKFARVITLMSSLVESLPQGLDFAVVSGRRRELVNRCWR